MEKLAKSTVMISVFLLAAVLILSVLWGDFGGGDNPEPVPSPTEVYVEPDVLTVRCETEYAAVGHTVPLFVEGTVSPLSYESLDPEVASVSDSGEITGIAPRKDDYCRHG